MQTVETLNEGLRRVYKITIPKKDIDARVGGELLIELEHLSNIAE